jgi:hypothetical protein
MQQTNDISNTTTAHELVVVRFVQMSRLADTAHTSQDGILTQLQHNDTGE